MSVSRLQGRGTKYSVMPEMGLTARQGYRKATLGANAAYETRYRHGVDMFLKLKRYNYGVHLYSININQRF